LTPSLVVCVLAVAGLLVAEWKRSRVGIILTKMTAATAFLAFALACGALDSAHGQVMLAGLALCWVGDACLLSPGQSTGFRIGIAAFLLGHVAYAIAFARLGFGSLGLLTGVLVAGATALGVLRWLRPHVPPELRAAVSSYVAVISLMLATAFAAVGYGASPIVGAGALGFVLSDLSVARDRFIAAGFSNAAWGLPLYFGSQMLLAYSIALERGAG
jgi:uncharacterized membrane protein YhhN